MTPELFPSGRLRLECAASIYDVYARTAKLDFFTPDTDPRPERSLYNTFLIKEDGKERGSIDVK